MKNYTTFLFFALALLITLIFSFKEKSHPETLMLDKTTYIYPIIDNEGTPKSLIRTLKVGYKDVNRKASTDSSIKYFCSFRSKLIMYSAFDSLELNSLPNQSCLIVAFFNLDAEQAKWFVKNNVFYLKIINTSTDQELIFENPEPRYFSEVFEEHNLIK